MMDQADDGIGVRMSIRGDEGWMVEFILDQNVKLSIRSGLLRCARNDIVKIVCQMRGVISPGKRDDLHRIALCAEIVHQPAVVHVPAAERVKRAVNDETDLHIQCHSERSEESLPFEAGCFVAKERLLSMTLTVNPICRPRRIVLPQDHFQACDVFCCYLFIKGRCQDPREMLNGRV